MTTYGEGWSEHIPNYIEGAASQHCSVDTIQQISQTQGFWQHMFCQSYQMVSLKMN